MTSIIKKIAIILLLIGAVVLAVILFRNKKSDEYRLVKTEAFSGSVIVERDSDTLDVFEGMKLISEDTVKVGDNSDLSLLVDTDKYLYAEANTVFSLEATGTVSKGSVRINIIKGRELFKIENKLSDESTFEVSTPNAIFGVRGTEFAVAYDEDNNTTILEVYEGVVSVDLGNNGNIEFVNAGEGRIISDDGMSSFLVGSSTVETATLTDVDDQAVSYHSWENIDNNDEAIKEGYRNILIDLDDFIAHDPIFNQFEVTTRQYVLFDINEDGREEVILILGYTSNDGVYCRVSAPLFYDKDARVIKSDYPISDTSDGKNLYGVYDGHFAMLQRINPKYDMVFVDRMQGDTLQRTMEGTFEPVADDVSDYGFTTMTLIDTSVLPFE